MESPWVVLLFSCLALLPDTMIAMDIIETLLIMVVLLSVLVFVHEGGHFLAARLFGMRCTEFMLGLPGPSIGFTRGGTRFGVTAVPLGGYARITGMTEPETPEILRRFVMALAYDRGEIEPEEIAFHLGCSVQEAYLALEDLCEWGSIERPRKNDRGNVYRTPASDSAPAGTPCRLYDVDAFFDLEKSQQYYVRPFWKRAVVLCAGPAMNLLLALAIFVFVYSIVGVDLTYRATGQTVHFSLPPLDAIAAGFNYIGQVVIAIAGLFNPTTVQTTISNSTSIVGIAVMSKSALDAGVLNLLMFSAMISVSLGLMNLLPFPPLDGGRFVIELVQRISGRMVSIKVQNALSYAGMALITLLFVVMLNQDIQRFVFGNWA